LELILDKLADNRCDHGDWADAKVSCTSAP